MNRNMVSRSAARVFEALVGDFAGCDHPSYFDLVPGAYGPSSAVELSHLMSGDDIIVSKFGRSLLVEPSPKTCCAAVSDSPLWAMNVTTQARALGLSDAPRG
jgi:hypothetical protein